MQAGDTYIRAGKHVNADPHLWVIISDPSQHANIVAVNVTTQRPGKDQSCVLQLGDHPFVTKQSVILYGGAAISPLSAILEGVQKGLVKKHDPVSVEILKRIQFGAEKSPNTPLIAKRMLREQGIIPKGK